MTYNVIDLFSGAGGLSLGFKQTGKINIVAAAENNPNARKTYKRNFKIERLYPDVRTIDYHELLDAVGHVDIVIGGPPCQGFSNANRQHSTIISMNNRLVKEYVRAICDLQPKAFVMENVAMLKSQVHRFLVEEADLEDTRIMSLNLSEDLIEILPENMYFEGALDVLQSALSGEGVWAEGFYKVLNLLYRYRINQGKFDSSLIKHGKKLSAQLEEIISTADSHENMSALQKIDYDMATAITGYMARATGFDETIGCIEKAIIIQKALMKIKELSDNSIHVYQYKEDSGKLVATVKSYAVLDYTDQDSKLFAHKKKLKHKNIGGYPCANDTLYKYSLGYRFQTDVTQIKFMDQEIRSIDEGISILYGVIRGVCSYLNIEQDDIAGCIHYFYNPISKLANYSLVLYDTTPGGAGHVKRIAEGNNLEMALREALRLMLQCDCGGLNMDTSCYSCLRTYRNQKYHDLLQRGYVVRFLESILK